MDKIQLTLNEIRQMETYLTLLDNMKRQWEFTERDYTNFLNEIKAKYQIAEGAKYNYSHDDGSLNLDSS